MPEFIKTQFKWLQYQTHSKQTPATVIATLNCGFISVQWNPVNMDTKGTHQSVRINRCPC